MLHLDKQKIRNPEFWNYWKVRPSSLQVLERGGPGPIGSRKRGPRVNFKGGGQGYSLTWTFYVLFSRQKDLWAPFHWIELVYNLYPYLFDIKMSLKTGKTSKDFRVVPLGWPASVAPPSTWNLHQYCEGCAILAQAHRGNGISGGKTVWLTQKCSL